MKTLYTGTVMYSYCIRSNLSINVYQRSRMSLIWPVTVLAQRVAQGRFKPNVCGVPFTLPWFMRKVFYCYSIILCYWIHTIDSIIQYCKKSAPIHDVLAISNAEISKAILYFLTYNFLTVRIFLKRSDFLIMFSCSVNQLCYYFYSTYNNIIHIIHIMQLNCIKKYII